MKKIVSFVLFIISFSACEKLIEEKVYTSIDSQALYSNEAGAEAALNGIYSNFLGFGFYGSVFPETTLNLSGLYTENVNSVDNKFNNPASLNFFNQIWSNIYQSIARTNDVIENVNKSGINEAAKNRILGEAYYIRAKNYFQLVRLFGGVPLRLKVSTLEDIHAPREPVEKIYTQILADLETAKKLLPEPGKQPVGKPHRFAAYALAQKVYVTLAGNDPTSPNWQKSMDEGLAVLNSGAYTLVRPYSALWEIKNKNSKEGIFEIQGSLLNNGDGASLTRMFLVSGPSTSLTPKADTWGRAKVNKEVYDLHRKQYPNDPRIDATYLDSFYNNRITNAVVNIFPLQAKTNKGFVFIRKYVDPDYLGTSSSNNFIFMRYADVLLMLAEAENELRGPTAAAYGYVNQVISRARDRNGNGKKK